MSGQDALLIAKKYVQVVGEKFPVDKAYLFGSFAKNKANEASDIDVCIISSRFGKDYWDEESELRKLTLKVDPRISPVAYNPQDFQNRWNLLIHEITTHGIQI